MIIYLAGGEGYKKRDDVTSFIKKSKTKGNDNRDEDISCRSITLKEQGGYSETIKNGVNILTSFYYADEWTEKMIPYFKNFLLDSGAFTFFSSGKTVDWDEYLKRYAGFIRRNNVEHFFELDIDVLVGYEKVIYFRKKLEDMTGKPCIPVWHKSRGKEEFLKMCEDYRYVAVGGIVTKEITRKEYPIFTYLIKEAHKRHAKIHGLGFTNLTGIKQYHFDSVDSTAWVSGNRFGHVYKFNGSSMEKHDKPKGCRLSNGGRDVAFHNFKEWAKFCEYAEKYL